jgi:hypothetical protein
MLRKRRRLSLVLLIYLVVGMIVAYDRDYISARLLKSVLSALLAIFLWILVLLGVNVRIR